MLKRSRASLLSRLPRQASLRLGWGLADQAVSSLTNFAVSIYVAKSLGATEFGAFSLAYVTYGFVLNASRGLATDPLLVRYSGAEIPAWRKAVSACTGTALGVGLITGLLAVGVAAFAATAPRSGPSWPWVSRCPASCCRTAGGSRSSPSGAAAGPSSTT